MRHNTTTTNKNNNPETQDTIRRQPTKTIIQRHETQYDDNQQKQKQKQKSKTKQI
jgi:hypothetical protein